MKLEKWALIAEIVGGIAIVVSLLVLIVEVRSNTEAVRAQTAQATFGISTQSFYYADGNVAMDKLQRGEELSVEEAAHAEALLAAIFTSFDNHFYQYLHGNLDEEIHVAYHARLRWLLNSEAIKRAWEFRRPFHTPAFRAHVDDLLLDLKGRVQ